MNIMKIKKAITFENVNKYLSGVSIIVLVILFTAMNPAFLGAINVKNILVDISPLLAMASGVACVLLLGSIDLSIGSICSCAVVMLTVLLQKIGIWAYPVVVVYGIIAGLINGIIFTKVKIPAFIVTLSTMSIWQSCAYIISGGMPLAMPSKIWGLVNWTKVAVGFIPLIFVLAVIIMCLFGFFQHRFVLGRGMIAVGANEKATRLMGLNVPRIKVMAFTLSGLGAAIGGIFFAAKLKSGIPTVGEPYQMMAIAAAVLSGISLSGGKGNIYTAILGVLLITLIQNGMNVIQVDGFWQQIVFGILIIFAISINTDRSIRGFVVK